MPAICTCPKCHQPLPPDAPQGLCPACLMRGALDSDPNLTTGPDSGPPLPVAGSVARALGVPAVVLREPPTEPPTPVNLPHSAEMPPPDPTGRLQVIGELARGGMGAILKGRDIDLGRDIAVKVLLETHAGKTELAQRFVEEAQIAGQLQHPGVVPVYELGQFPDKRPYFTMKLVKGQTLAKLLAERAPGASTDVPRFLGIFQQVCQTLAYAHARGVIHRDLKPSNVMVGAFGEVQVMDWGLAKVLKEGGVADEGASREREQTDAMSVIQTARQRSSETHVGSVLGTPAYMAPEQARGEVELIDQRADVFGLGAILCEILTREAPFTGKPAEAQRKARQGDLSAALARLDACGADNDLIALAKQCLAAEPWHRPKDASEVAGALNAYQESVQRRLHEAELAEAQARAKAEEERKRRKLVLALAASIIGALVLAGGGGFWFVQDRAEREREAVTRQTHLERQIVTALEDAVRLREQGRTTNNLAKWGEARGMALKAESLRQNGDIDPELSQRIDALLAELADEEADRELVVRLEKVRLNRIENQWVRHKVDYTASANEYAAAFRQVGWWQDDLAAVTARIRGSAVRAQLVAGLDDWALATPDNGLRSRLFQIGRQVDPDPRRDRLRDPAICVDLKSLEKLATEAPVAEWSPHLLTVLELRIRRLGGDGLPLLRAAQRQYPGDVWLNYHLASALSKSKKAKPREAIEFLRIVLAIRPDSAIGWANLAASLNKDGGPEEAIAACEQAIKLDPNQDNAYGNLGSALLAKKNLDGAVAAYRKAIKLNRNNPIHHSNLGNALRENKDLDGAIVECKKAIALDPSFAPAYYNLGLALYAKQDLNGAIAEYKKAIARDPNDAHAYDGLGTALYAEKDVQGSIDAYQKALRVDPEFAMSHYNLGIIWHHRRDLDGAIAAYNRAIELNPRFVLAYNNLATALVDQKEPNAAIAACQKAIRLDPTFAKSYLNLGGALYSKGDLDGAINAYERGIKLDPIDADAHAGLARLLLDKKNWDGAIVALNTAIRLNPGFVAAHNGLGLALLEAGRFKEAQTALRKCLELIHPKDASRGTVSKTLQQCEHLLALDEKLSAILDGKAQPADAAERIALANLCQRYKQRHVAAVRFFTDAFAADAKLADDMSVQNRYNAACSAAMAVAGQGKDAEKLTDQERARLHQQALAWLRADLAAWTKLADNPKEHARIRENLLHWQKDTDLAGLRDKDTIAKLPADERKAWQKLWIEVASLVSKVKERQ